MIIMPYSCCPTLESESFKPFFVVNKYFNCVFNPFRLYAAGAQPAVNKLYRPVTYPVGRGTPMLNSKVDWDHSQRFLVPKLGTDGKITSFRISLFSV